MLATLGMPTEVRLVQDSNAESPILVALGKDAEVRLEH